LGQDKWLGGCLGSDGIVYGVPGHAKTVLKIVPGTDEVTEVGGPFEGKFKWLRGVLGRDQCVYGIPCWADTVLKIDCRTGDISTFGDLQKAVDMYLPFQIRGVTTLQHEDGNRYRYDANGLGNTFPLAYRNSKDLEDHHSELDLAHGETVEGTVEHQMVDGGESRPNKWLKVGKGRFKWHGGVLGSDGAIYGIPANADSVLKIVPSTGEVTTIGGPFPGEHKWYGGLLGHDGNIYGMPASADCVLKIMPATGEVTTIGSLPKGGWKWHGGVVAPNGNMYALPSNSDDVLKVVPATGEVSIIKGKLKSGRHRTDGKYKYLGGVLGGDGCIYGMPGDAETVLKINPETDELSLIGGPFLGENKWQNGFLAKDGAIYGIPLRAEAVIKIVPSTGEVTTVGGPLPGKDKWEGGVIVGGGDALYGMPLRCKSVLKIAPC